MISIKGLYVSERPGKVMQQENATDIACWQQNLGGVWLLHAMRCTDSEAEHVPRQQRLC
jgi:hypothetical protein